MTVPAAQDEVLDANMNVITPAIAATNYASVEGSIDMVDVTTTNGAYVSVDGGYHAENTYNDDGLGVQTYTYDETNTASSSVTVDVGSYASVYASSDVVSVTSDDDAYVSVDGGYTYSETETYTDITDMSEDVIGQAYEDSYSETVTASSSVTVDAGYGASLYGSSDVTSVNAGDYAYVNVDGGYTDSYTRTTTPVEYSGTNYSGVDNITTASTDNSSTTAASLLEVTAGSYASVYGSADEVVVTSGGDADVDVSGNSTYSYEYAANAKQGSGTDYFGNSYTYAYGETTLSTSDVFVSASTSVEVTGGSNYYDQVNVNGSAVEITASGYNVNIGNYSGASTGGGWYEGEGMYVYHQGVDGGYEAHTSYVYDADAGTTESSATLDVLAADSVTVPEAQEATETSPAIAATNYASVVGSIDMVDVTTTDGVYISVDGGFHAESSFSDDGLDTATSVTSSYTETALASSMVEITTGGDVSGEISSNTVDITAHTFSELHIDGGYTYDDTTEDTTYSFADMVTLTGVEPSGCVVSGNSNIDLYAVEATISTGLGDDIVAAHDLIGTQQLITIDLGADSTEGPDTVVFDGNRNDYTFVFNVSDSINEVTVTSRSSDADFYHLMNVEVLQFADHTTIQTAAFATNVTLMMNQPS